jgi:hypothetical protein
VPPWPGPAARHGQQARTGAGRSGETQEGNHEHQLDPRGSAAPAGDRASAHWPPQPSGLLRATPGRTAPLSEASMIELYLLIAFILVLMGAAGGFMIVIALASRRDRDITRPASSRLVRGARTVNRLHSRGPGVLREAAYRHDLPRLTGREGNARGEDRRPRLSRLTLSSGRAPRLRRRPAASLRTEPVPSSRPTSTAQENYHATPTSLITLFLAHHC